MLIYYIIILTTNEFLLTQHFSRMVFYESPNIVECDIWKIPFFTKILYIFLTIIAVPTILEKGDIAIFELRIIQVRDDRRGLDINLVTISLGGQAQIDMFVYTFVRRIQ